MYPQPGQTGQWNPNATPPSSAAQPQQAQQQWAPAPAPQHSPNGHHQQPNGQYAPQQQRPQGQMPPISQGGPPPGPPMNPLQPQPHDPYRSLPPPGHMYAQSPYHGQPPIHYPPQPAPRQRTAIACRYCRRRKIRCSGFEHSEDGRCTNCQRFNQECIFTPVSHQTQAFVPAHAVMGRGNGQIPQQLYGAYGQPLPVGQYYPPPYGQPPNGYPGYPPQPMQPGQLPPPGQQGGASSPHGVPSPSQQPPQAAGQKRSNDEPHTPTQAPPPPGNAGPPPQGQQRSASTSSAASQSGQSGQPHFYPTPASQPGQHGQVHANTPPPQSVAQDAQLKSDQNSTISPETNLVNGGYPAPTSDANVPLPAPGQEESNSPTNGTPKNNMRINELVGEKGAVVPSSPEQIKTSPSSIKGKQQS